MLSLMGWIYIKLEFNYYCKVSIDKLNYYSISDSLSFNEWSSMIFYCKSDIIFSWYNWFLLFLEINSDILDLIVY